MLMSPLASVLAALAVEELRLVMTEGQMEERLRAFRATLAASRPDATSAASSLTG
jgi:hypothetical protein